MPPVLGLGFEHVLCGAQAEADSQLEAQALMEREDEERRRKTRAKYDDSPPGKVYIDSPTTLHKYR